MTTTRISPLIPTSATSKLESLADSLARVLNSSWLSPYGYAVSNLTNVAGNILTTCKIISLYNPVFVVLQTNNKCNSLYQMSMNRVIVIRELKMMSLRRWRKKWVNRKYVGMTWFLDLVKVVEDMRFLNLLIECLVLHYNTWESRELWWYKAVTVSQA